MCEPLGSRFLLLASLLLVGIANRVAAGPQGQKPLRLDQYGGPLPVGALARLGTLRLVHVGQLTSVAVSADGKLAASGVSDGKVVGLTKKIIHKSEGRNRSPAQAAMQ